MNEIPRKRVGARRGGDPARVRAEQGSFGVPHQVPNARHLSVIEDIERQHAAVRKRRGFRRWLGMDDPAKGDR